MRKITEGSLAVAEIINMCRPQVVSAYPITPQTHIVEELAKIKANGQGSFEFIRAESEFSAGSIVLGASASGVRAYTATSSQGLLYMTEVLFTISGMRLPLVMTCANRAISAPINIWNDEQDSMTVRDAGWIMLYAENNQEAVDFHPIAFKISEQLNIPVMVNMDGFVLTHTIEPVDMPDLELIKNYLPERVPLGGEYLDVNNPVSLGSLVTPEYYQQIRQDLHNDLVSSQKTVKQEMKNYAQIFGRGFGELVEYFGNHKASTVIVSRGSVCGTIKQVLSAYPDVALARLKCYRPFPVEELKEKLKNAKNIIVLEKCLSLGKGGPVFSEVRDVLWGMKNIKKIRSFIGGLGGRDITEKMVISMIKKSKLPNEKMILL